MYAVVINSSLSVVPIRALFVSETSAKKFNQEQWQGIGEIVPYFDLLELVNDLQQQWSNSHAL